MPHNNHHFGNGDCQRGAHFLVNSVCVPSGEGQLSAANAPEVAAGENNGWHQHGSGIPHVVVKCSHCRELENGRLICKQAGLTFPKNVVLY